MLAASLDEISLLAREATDLAAGRRQQRRLYIAMVDQQAAQIAAPIEVLAEEGPVGFGCAAGKDRTGLLTAVLHVLLGANVAEAAAAYVAQAPTLDQVLPLAPEHFRLVDGEEIPTGILAHLTVETETIVAALEHLANRYGGVEVWLIANGITAETISRLRAKLIEPPDRT
jgi:protein-tyrosine phosphatase